MIAQHKYPFAINEDGKPIHINEVSENNRKTFRFHCYGCGARLFPVLGDIQHHFRHEKDAICDPNKYLHEFAKATIKKRFDENEHFIVEYNTTKICKHKQTCKFATQFQWEECVYDSIEQLDLKEYYDTCTAEKGYYQELPDGRKKYIADLILTNSQDESIPPICIEIWVNHECTEDKKQNGGRIIEIKITCEQDAKRPLIESDDEKLPIRFFNFKRTIEIEPSRKFKHVKLLPGIFRKVIVTDETLCSEGLQFDPKGENEVIFSTTNIQPNLLSILYDAKCNEKGYVKQTMLFCEYGIFVNVQTWQLGCRYNKKCPCEYYTHNLEKAKSFLKSLEKLILGTNIK